MMKYRKEVQLSIFLIVISFIVTTFESSMVMPLGPIIAQQYDISIEMITYLNIGFNIAGLLTPIMGFLSDKYSAKHALLVGMMFFGVGCYIVSIDSLETYIVGRFILGIGYYSLLTLRFSYTSKLVEEKELGKISSLYKVAFATGAFLSPYTSHFLLDILSFQMIYLILGTMSLLLAWRMKGLVFVKPEANHISKKEIYTLIKSKVARFSFLINLFISIPTIFFYTYASVYMAAQGISYSTISLYYTIAAVGAIVGGVLISKGCRLFGLHRLCVYSAISCSVLLIGISLFPLSYLLAFLFGAAFDLLWGVFYPSCSLYYPKQSALFLTLLGMINAMVNTWSALVAPTIFMALGYPMILIICSTTMMLAGIMMIKMKENEK